MRYTINQQTPSVRKCAFCKKWYDPTNSAIAPRRGHNFWDYDPKMKKKCSYLGRETIASNSCSQFELKDL